MNIELEIKEGIQHFIKTLKLNVSNSDLNNVMEQIHIKRRSNFSKDIFLKVCDFLHLKSMVFLTYTCKKNYAFQEKIWKIAIFHIVPWTTLTTDYRINLIYDTFKYNQNNINPTIYNCINNRELMIENLIKKKHKNNVLFEELQDVCLIRENKEYINRLSKKNSILNKKSIEYKINRKEILAYVRQNSQIKKEISKYVEKKVDNEKIDCDINIHKKHIEGYFSKLNKYEQDFLNTFKPYSKFGEYYTLMPLSDFESEIYYKNDDSDSDNRYDNDNCYDEYDYSDN